MAADRGSRRCKAPDCGEKSVHETVSDKKIYSMYCQNHTCMAPRNQHHPFCINHRNPHNRYCAFHGKCRAHGCTQLAPRQ
ncbi:hypothetical protein M406DRAFT_357309, partial [Cryphonectria parasitica EP155]